MPAHGANGQVVDSLSIELGRDPRAIRRSICASAERVATFETQVEYVERYSASGVDTFIYNMSMPNTPEAVPAVGLRLPALRQRFAPKV